MTLGQTQAPDPRGGSTPPTKHSPQFKQTLFLSLKIYSKLTILYLFSKPTGGPPPKNIVTVLRTVDLASGVFFSTVSRDHAQGVGYSYEQSW